MRSASAFCLPALLGVLGVLSGCGQKDLPVAQLPPPSVTVSRPIVREVTDYDEYDGRIAAVKTVEVRARVRGHLQKVLFKDGQLVKKGEPLFEIDPRPYKAALDAALATKASADASLQLAKAEYARVQGLVQRKAASREELDVLFAKQATSKADQQKAEAEIERARLDVGFCTVTAEIDGRISRPLITEGNLVNAGGGDTLLTTIVSTNPMYVYFPVDERSLLRYRRDYGKNGGASGEESIKDLKIPVQVALEGDTKFVHQGFIDLLDNRINPRTGTVEARGVLPNTNRLMDDGMRARVRVPARDPEKTELIDERAIGTDQGTKYVFVVNADRVAERRVIQPGRNFDGLVAIATGLKPEEWVVKPGEWVVVNGLQRVREGMKVDAKEAPMPEVGKDGAHGGKPDRQ